MPTVAQLPDDLRPLATLQAVVLRDESWHRDFEELVVALGGASRRRIGPVPGVVAVLALVAVLAGVGTWPLLRERDRDGDGASVGSPGVTMVSQATCPTPRPPAWTELARFGTAGGGPGATWGFEVTGGGCRP